MQKFRQINLLQGKNFSKKEENNINRLEKNLQKENDENVRGVINETDDKNTLKKNKSKLF